MKIGYTGEFYYTYAEEIPNLHIFQKIEVEGKSPQSFYEAYEASITLIPKPDKANAGNKNYRRFNEQRCKTPQKRMNKYNQTMYKKDLWPVKIYLKNSLTSEKSVTVI